MDSTPAPRSPRLSHLDIFPPQPRRRSGPPGEQLSSSSSVLYAENDLERRGGTATIELQRSAAPSFSPTRLRLSPGETTHHARALATEMSGLGDQRQVAEQQQQQRDSTTHMYSHWSYSPFPAGQLPPRGAPNSLPSPSLSSFSSAGSSYGSAASTCHPTDRHPPAYPSYTHPNPLPSMRSPPRRPPPAAPDSTLEHARSSPFPDQHHQQPTTAAAEDHEWSIRSAQALRNLAHVAAEAEGQDFGAAGGGKGFASGLTAPGEDSDGTPMRWYSPSPPPEGIWDDERPFEEKGQAPEVGDSHEVSKGAGTAKGKKGKPGKKTKKNEDAVDAVARKYVCQECRKSFARPSALVVHERSHSQIQPHVCPVCQRPFNVPSNLRRHQRLYNHHDSTLSPADAHPSPSDEPAPPTVSVSGPPPASLARLLLPIDLPSAQIGSPAFADSESS
ncbi:hypothetical protein BCR35DRAFT_304058 [Leucosporidium creatinivorum]|uniref:C2H2-type domain-containing protein n=1 Tax=Leucosporidium creatinivorum TaxID=106004 RepID=A0A1Y2FB99_9BASI|nr:hypothetical protein BCR35DRAFT_304058 [Leucosporidium creatinivorum]